MTLLITVFAAVIATVKWYTRKDDTLQLGILVFMFWGASLMWLGDAIFGYIESGADYFTPAPDSSVWPWSPWLWSSGWCGFWSPTPGALSGTPWYGP